MKKRHNHRRYCKSRPTVQEPPTDPICGRCQRAFADIGSLRKHNHYCKDGSDEDKQCPFCGHTFPTKAGAGRHAATYCPDRPSEHPERIYHECAHCQKQFGNIQRKEDHENVCPANPVTARHSQRTCSWCWKTFPTVSGCQQHMARYCKAKPPPGPAPSRPDPPVIMPGHTQPRGTFEPTPPPRNTPQRNQGPSAQPRPGTSSARPGPSRDPTALARRLPFKCRLKVDFEFPPEEEVECDKRFASEIGRSQHERRAHPVQYNQAVAELPEPKRVAYTDEEMAIVARAEVELRVASGVTASTDKVPRINQLLWERLKGLPGFTRDVHGIANMRKCDKFKRVFQGLHEEVPEDAVMELPIGTEPEPSADEGVDVGAGSDELQPIRDYLSQSLGSSPSEVWEEERLNLIIEAALCGEDIDDELQRYAHDILSKPIASQPRSSATTATSSASSSRRPHSQRRPTNNRNNQNSSTARPCNRAQRKRHQYALHQRLYDSDRRRLARAILDGRKIGEPPGVYPGVVEAWCKSFEENPGPTDTSDMEPYPSFTRNVWRPISGPEVGKYLKQMPKGAPGPDGVTVERLKAASSGVLSKVLNLFMLRKRLPSGHLISRTVLIPKVDSPGGSSDFRPISVANVIVRLFHRILAARVMGACHIDARQRGFLPVDGCADNLALLEAIIGEARRECKSAFIASLDVKNAFGSVSHEALFKALELGGAPVSLVDYIRSVYASFSTEVSLGGEAKTAKINRGVLQGCPLSPVLFNLVINQLLTKMPPATGFKLVGGDLTALVDGAAFADDLLTIASTAAGAQIQLEKLEALGPKWGLVFNPRKCRALALRVRAIRSYRGKKVFVDSKVQLRLHGEVIEAVKCEESWKYLGMLFGYRGTEAVDVPLLKQLKAMLARLRAFCLKPQQKLEILRTFLMPRLIYRLSNSAPHGGLYRKLDNTIRAFLKTEEGLLRLPKDTPNAYFYAPIKEGGLGLLSFKASVPAMIYRRYSALKESTSIFARTAHACTTIQQKIDRAWAILPAQESGERLEFAPLIQVYHSKALHDRIDGKALVESNKVNKTHTWVRDHSHMLSGRDFVNAVKLRINALPVLSRTSRGTRSSRKCRAGCDAAESLDHVLQMCQKSWGPRIERHDKIVERMATYAEQQQYRVEKEPWIKIPSGTGSQGVRGNKCRPDLILYDGLGKAFVVDVIICGGNQDLKKVYDLKVRKYQEVEAVGLHCRNQGAPEVSYHALVINNRGVMAQGSYVDLTSRLRFKLGVVITFVVMALEGSIKTWKLWNRSTARYWLGNRRE